jgi:hypothetical protein
VAPGIVGVFAGRIAARQLWADPIATEAVTGITAGIFVEAQTPLSFLSIRAEAGYAAKGTEAWDVSSDPDRLTPARVRTHYLTVPIHGKVGVGLGPLSVYLFGGPTVDFLLATDCSEPFCQFIRDEKGAVLNAAIGGGVELDAPGGYRVGVEGRITEGLGEAYLGEFDSARNRSTALLIRLGRSRRDR